MPTNHRAMTISATVTCLLFLAAAQATIAAPADEPSGTAQITPPTATLQAEPDSKPAPPGDDAERPRRRGGRRGPGQSAPRFRDDGAPKAGDDAKLFKLKRLNEEREVDLNQFAGKRPVVLFFGSYT